MAQKWTMPVLATLGTIAAIGAAAVVTAHTEDSSTNAYGLIYLIDRGSEPPKVCVDAKLISKDIFPLIVGKSSLSHFLVGASSAYISKEIVVSGVATWTMTLELKAQPTCTMFFGPVNSVQEVVQKYGATRVQWVTMAEVASIVPDKPKPVVVVPTDGQPEIRACTAEFERVYNRTTRDKYDPSIVRQQKITLYFQGLQRNGFFGNHKFEVVVYFIDKLENGQIINRSDQEMVYCVLDDSNNVLGVEDNFVR